MPHKRRFVLYSLKGAGIDPSFDDHTAWLAGLTDSIDAFLFLQEATEEREDFSWVFPWAERQKQFVVRQNNEARARVDRTAGTRRKDELRAKRRRQEDLARRRAEKEFAARQVVLRQTRLDEYPPELRDQVASTSPREPGAGFELNDNHSPLDGRHFVADGFFMAEQDGRLRTFVIFPHKGELLTTDPSNCRWFY